VPRLVFWALPDFVMGVEEMLPRVGPLARGTGFSEKTDDIIENLIFRSGLSIKSIPYLFEADVCGLDPSPRPKTSALEAVLEHAT